MKRFLMGTMFMVVIFWTVSLLAADYITAVGPDNGIIIAARPYAEVKEAKRLEAFKSFKRTRIVPVGIMIQNNGNHRIWVFRDVAFKNTGTTLYAFPMIESAERPLGVLGGYNFFDDGQNINKDIHARYNKGGELPRLSQNEVFSPDWVEPGESYYGLVYVAMHEPKGPEQYQSIHHLKSAKTPVGGVMKAVNDAMVSISYLAPESKNQYTAELPLAVTPDSRGTIAFAGKMSGGELESRTGLFYAGPAGDNPSTEMYLDQCKAFQSCYFKSILRSAVKAYSKYYGKSESAATLSYNNFGELATETLDQSSENSLLNKKLLRVIHGMKQCDYPQMRERKDDKFGKGHAVYQYKIKLGRVF